MKLRVAVASVFASTLLFGLPANASTYNFTFTGTDFTASGTLITSDTPDSLGGYDVLSISGNVSGPISGGITGLVANPSQPDMATFYAPSGRGWYYDNVIYNSPSAAFVDYYGVLFSFDSGEYANLYWNGAYFLSIDTPGSLWDPGDQGRLAAVDPPGGSADAVPGPVVGAGLPGLFLAAGGLLGWWRRKRKAEAIA